LAAFGPVAAEGLRRLAGFDAAGDLIAIGHVDPGSGTVLSFEELVGSHGGLGGPQERPFVAAPPAWPRLSSSPVGADAVHRQLADWLSALPALLVAGPIDAQDHQRRRRAAGSGASTGRLFGRNRRTAHAAGR
jgi:hypothetical protein